MSVWCVFANRITWLLALLGLIESAAACPASLGWNTLFIIFTKFGNKIKWDIGCAARAGMRNPRTGIVLLVDVSRARWRFTSTWSLTLTLTLDSSVCVPARGLLITVVSVMLLV